MFCVMFKMCRRSLVLDVEFASAVKLQHYMNYFNTSYNFTLCTYVTSVYLDLFNMECVYKQKVILPERGISKNDLHLIVDYKGNTEQNGVYNCMIRHISSGQNRSYSLEIFGYKSDKGEQKSIDIIKYLFDS